MTKATLTKEGFLLVDTKSEQAELRRIVALPEAERRRELAEYFRRGSADAAERARLEIDRLLLTE